MARTVAFQDVSFFENGTVFSDTPAVSLVTSTYEVTPSWLVHSLISLVLGRPKTNNKITPSAQSPPPQHVVLISLVDRSTLYNRALLKNGIDLNRKKQALPGEPAAFTWIDLSVHLDSDFATLKSEIETRIGKTQPESTLIIFENPDLLLPLAMATPPAVLELCGFLQTRCTNLYLLVNADAELLTQAQTSAGDGAGTLLETGQTALVLGLLYRSTLSIAVRPLSTGRANDVSGVLSISKGPASTDSKVVEDSFQFFVSGDGVKLFYR